MLFLILAVKSSKQKEISFNSLLRRDWRTLRKPLIYSLLTGIALGFYLLSWVGGALIVFIIFVYAFIQYAIDHLRGRSTDYLCIVGIPALLVALFIVLPFSRQLGMGELQIASLLIAILAFLGLSGLSLLMTRREIKRGYYPLVIAVLAGIGLAAFYLVDPSLLNSMLERLSVFRPTGSVQTIGEIKPLSFSIIWEEFTTGFYLSLISFVIIAYLVIKEGAADKTLLFVWSVIMLVATFGQNRFAYYFAVNVAILTGYLSWKMLSLVRFRETPKAGKEEKIGESRKQKMAKQKAKSSKKAKRKKAQAQRKETGTLVTRYPISRYAYSVILMVAVFFLAFYPNIGMAINAARHGVYPSQDWHDALVWMRENTPEPFQDAAFYYKLYQRPAEGEYYNYPESAYGVMSWWDYGHWITYMAHRIPNANPHQAGASSAAEFFTAQDESSANEVLDEHGSRYIIIDGLMALHEIDPKARIYGHFYAMLDWAGKDRERFYEVYYQKEGGKLTPVTLYYPAYYQSMSSRLYIFGGEKWVPTHSTLVISYIEKTNTRGVKYKEISDRRNFATYEEAEAFLELHGSSNYRMVGDNQLLSPVPLEKLEHYRLIYKSPGTMAVRGNETISKVEIFEYIP